LKNAKFVIEVKKTQTKSGFDYAPPYLSLPLDMVTSYCTSVMYSQGDGLTSQICQTTFLVKLLFRKGESQSVA